MNASRGDGAGWRAAATKGKKLGHNDEVAKKEAEAIARPWSTSSEAGGDDAEADGVEERRDDAEETK